MRETTVNKFRSHLKDEVEDVIANHEPLRVTRRNSEDFVVISAEDWEREQETLYLLENSDLMKQIAQSLQTHTDGAGYSPGKEELDEINNFPDYQAFSATVNSLVGIGAVLTDE